MPQPDIHRACRRSIFSLLTLIVLLPSAGARKRPTFATIFDFGGPYGSVAQYSGVVVGNGGVLYGTTVTGGTDCNCGTVFSLTPPASAGGTWKQVILYSFTGNGDGSAPYAGLVLGEDGTLYGTTSGGGTLGFGAVFSLTPPGTQGGSWVEQVLYSFQGGNDGYSPQQPLAFYGGTLYGVTPYGGTSDSGTVFSLTPPSAPGGAWTETVLHSFTGGSDGGLPEAGLAIGPGGVLYGSAFYGGTMRCNGSGCGTLFALSPPATSGSPWTFNLLHKFAGSTGPGSPNPDGARPAGTLRIGRGGALYGVTQNGGTEFQGVVFELAPPASAGAAWTETVLYTFSGINGASPWGGLIIGENGVLYGTTQAGVAFAAGLVFSLRPPKTAGPWLEIPLHTFSGLDGRTPLASLVFGGNSVLYGTTWQGGTANAGTIFQLTP